MGACGRQHVCERALVHVCTKEAIAPVPGPAARACVPSSANGAHQIGAGGVLAAQVGARGPWRTLVDVGAGDAVRPSPVNPRCAVVGKSQGPPPSQPASFQYQPRNLATSSTEFLKAGF